MSPTPVPSGPSSELCGLSALELRRGFLAKDFTPVEALEAVAGEIDRTQTSVNAFTTLCLEDAAVQAQSAARAYERGEAAGELTGVPLCVKDLFDTEGLRTTYGSAMFASHVPSRDAAAVRKARAAGCIVVGKTGTHEFGWGITSENPHFGAVHNPWSLERVAGGSSGGSAAALAKGASHLALGSDTGGSIRIPAAFCGVVGFKPTYARVSSDGIFPLAPSLDHAGAMARTPDDARALLRAIEVPQPASVSVWSARGDAKPVVAICPDLHLAPLTAANEQVFMETLEVLESTGVSMVEAPFPAPDAILETFRSIQRAEAVHAHRRAGLFPERSEEYGDDVRGRLEQAASVTLDEYLDALQRRQRIRNGFEELFERGDILVTPVSSVAPVAIGEAQNGFRDAVMSYTVPQNLAGLPACAVRAGFDDAGMPVGVQFTGASGTDDSVLELAQIFFEASGEAQRVWPSLQTERALETTAETAD